MIEWKLEPRNPVIQPGDLNGPLDAKHAGAGTILQLGDQYRLYYWAIGSDGVYRICQGDSSVDSPNDWQGLGSILEPQPDTDYNCQGPSFPFVIPADGDRWLLYFGAWGKPREDGTLPNSTGLAVSEDAGKTWNYDSNQPILPLDRPYDQSATGSVFVLREGGQFQMYYTSIGDYFPRPEGVKTGHGDIIPRIGIAYATSEDGVHWAKPLVNLMVAPRAFDSEPYEYISSKPWIVREEQGYRMWISSCRPRYRICSLTSPDALNWTWMPSGPDGDLGVGAAGAFDDVQRSYATVIRHGDEYRCWYTGNNFGRTGMGYAVGRASG